MHGVQPTPGPAPMPSVVLADVSHSGMLPMTSQGHDRQMPSHPQHGGGEVCLAMILMAALALLVARVLMASLAAVSDVAHHLVPRPAPALLPRGPTLATLCVLRR